MWLSEWDGHLRQQFRELMQEHGREGAEYILADLCKRLWPEPEQSPFERAISAWSAEHYAGFDVTTAKRIDSRRGFG